MGIRGLISTFRARSTTPRTAIELLAVEGLDVGRRFTVFANRVDILRGQGERDSPRTITLRDRTVSSRQAVLRHVPGGYEIEHDQHATNPTLVNDHAVALRRIRPGDRIQVGRVVLEVQNQRSSVSGIFEVPAADEPETWRTASKTTPGLPETDSTSELGADPTQPTPVYGLSVIAGYAHETFQLHQGDTVIGRLGGCDIALTTMTAVSRQHARIERDGDRLTLVHLSRVNPTRVNGMNVLDRQHLLVGDDVEIAGCVTFRLVGPSRSASGGVPENLAVEVEGMMRRKEDIAARFAVTGTFLDVDIVGSFELKSDTPEAERIILSFERWRAWMTRKVRDAGGDVLNSNGDELMCFFESPLAALEAGHAILGDLARFNAEESLLARKIQLRVGVHTGNALVDRNRGVAYSAVLDITGHLQKAAPINGLLLSEATERALPGDRPAHLALEALCELDGLGCYRFVSLPGETPKA